MKLENLICEFLYVEVDRNNITAQFLLLFIIQAEDGWDKTR